MNVLALFSDNSAEKIVISSLLQKEDEKGILIRSTISDNVLKDSVIKCVHNTYNCLLINRYNNLSLLYPISVCIFGFSGKVIGNSADLAFSIGFIVFLINNNILKSTIDGSLNIAATGIINDRMKIEPICNLENKLDAARKNNANIVFIPFENYEEMKTLCLIDKELSTWINGIKVCPVKSLEEVLDFLQVSEEESPSETHIECNKIGMFEESSKDIIIKDKSKKPFYSLAINLKKITFKSRSVISISGVISGIVLVAFLFYFMNKNPKDSFAFTMNEQTAVEASNYGESLGQSTPLAKPGFQYTRQNEPSRANKNNYNSYKDSPTNPSTDGLDIHHSDPIEKKNVQEKQTNKNNISKRDEKEKVMVENDITKKVIDEKVIDEKGIDEKGIDEKVIDEKVIDEKVIDEKVPNKKDADNEGEEKEDGNGSITVNGDGVFIIGDKNIVNIQ